jgi:hypothetical protein
MGWRKSITKKSQLYCKIHDSSILVEINKNVTQQLNGPQYNQYMYIPFLCVILFLDFLHTEMTKSKSDTCTGKI